MAADGLGLAVVVVSYHSAADLPRTLGALAEQLHDHDELIIVDNAPGDGSAEAARAAAPQARIVQPGANLGFAGGCNAGAAASAAPLVLFLNPDATPAAGCLDALRATAAERPGWGAWQALVTLPGGDTINTSGGITHFLGVGWAGSCGQPLRTAPPGSTEVSFASGAALVVRRKDWERVGGFDERYFMYSEDLDLSLRLRLVGCGVGVAPDARVQHEYEYDKGSQKWFLLERNRLWTVLSDYPAALLAVLAPALLAFELALLAFAARGGWLREKLRAQRAVLGALPAILERRSGVQSMRTVSAADFAAWLSADLDSPYLAGAARLSPLVTLQRLYWRAVLAVLRW